MFSQEGAGQATKAKLIILYQTTNTSQWILQVYVKLWFYDRKTARCCCDWRSFSLLSRVTTLQVAPCKLQEHVGMMSTAVGGRHHHPQVILSSDSRVLTSHTHMRWLTAPAIKKTTTRKKRNWEIPSSRLTRVPTCQADDLSERIWWSCGAEGESESKTVEAGRRESRLLRLDYERL